MTTATDRERGIQKPSIWLRALALIGLTTLANANYMAAIELEKAEQEANRKQQLHNRELESLNNASNALIEFVEGTTDAWNDALIDLHKRVPKPFEGVLEKETTN